MRTTITRARISRDIWPLPFSSLPLSTTHSTHTSHLVQSTCIHYIIIRRISDVSFDARLNISHSLPLYALRCTSCRCQFFFFLSMRHVVDVLMSSGNAHRTVRFYFVRMYMLRQQQQRQQQQQQQPKESR